MCGLAGWIGAPHPEVLGAMLETLIPRGPDAYGMWDDQDIHLGHRRLKVIDLKGGTQPMESPSSVLIFNGEIYNFQELKQDLNFTGEFKTNSDTEVLQRALETWGLDALKRLRGMFAFAFWDKKNQSLLLARDAVGQKPLFWSDKNNLFAFASTCRALRRHPEISDELNRQALATFLSGEAPQEPLTLYKDIHSLLPGHWLRYEKGKIEQGSWWQWPEVEPHNQLDSEEFDTLLQQAVKRRLISDVPLGVFLSGGLDSSAVTYLTRGALENQPLKTFSIGFEEKSYDESSYARSIAKRFDCDHHEEVLSEKRILENIEPALNNCDQPLADSSLLPTFLLCRLARKSVTVCLSGDGSDDVMAGYDPFKALWALPYLNSLPESIYQMLKKQLDRCRPRNQNLPWPFKLRQFLRARQSRGGEAGRRWMSAWSDHDLKDLLPETSINTWEAKSNSSRSDLINWFRQRYLRDQILVKVDRASMAWGLEVRNPFLDLDLIEMLAKLSFKNLFDKGRGKLPLRQWASTRLPQSVLTRPKKGFGMPIAQWLRGPLRNWAQDLITKPRLEEMGLEPHLALKTVQEHLSGQLDRRKEVWTLATLCHWWMRR